MSNYPTISTHEQQTHNLYEAYQLPTDFFFTREEDQQEIPSELSEKQSFYEMDDFYNCQSKLKEYDTTDLSQSTTTLDQIPMKQNFSQQKITLTSISQKSKMIKKERKTKKAPKFKRQRRGQQDDISFLEDLKKTGYAEKELADIDEFLKKPKKYQDKTIQRIQNRISAKNNRERKKQALKKSQDNQNNLKDQLEQLKEQFQAQQTQINQQAQTIQELQNNPLNNQSFKINSQEQNDVMFQNYHQVHQMLIRPGKTTKFFYGLCLMFLLCCMLPAGDIQKAQGNTEIAFYEINYESSLIAEEYEIQQIYEESRRIEEASLINATDTYEKKIQLPNDICLNELVNLKYHYLK